MNKHGRVGVKREKPAGFKRDAEDKAYRRGFSDGAAQVMEFHLGFCHTLAEKKNLKDIKGLIKKELGL